MGKPVLPEAQRQALKLFMRVGTLIDLSTSIGLDAVRDIQIEMSRSFTDDLSANDLSYSRTIQYLNDKLKALLPENKPGTEGDTQNPIRFADISDDELIEAFKNPIAFGPRQNITQPNQGSRAKGRILSTVDGRPLSMAEIDDDSFFRALSMKG